MHGATLLANSLVLGVLWQAVMRDRSLLETGNADEVESLKAIGRAIVPGIGLYVVATGIAFVAPGVGVWAYLLIALLLVVRVRDRDRPEPETA